MSSVENNNYCTGCGACVTKCPTSAIKIQQDCQGRFKAFVNSEKCINCSKCSANCPVINPKYENDPTPACYAFDTNEQLNMTSATAGGFQILAKHFINNDGKVVGAGWVPDEHGNYTTVKHIMVDNADDLKYLYKSKYLQSDMNNIYEQTKQELEKGTKVLFSGVSCQIAGLYSMLNKDYENLYTIDLICYHAPSQGYFKKYLDEQFGENNVKEFDFRAKNNNDRYSLNLRAKLNSGEEIFKSHWEDSFCKLFQERYIMDECCEHCRFAKYPKQGDITLGDFHRIEQVDPDFLDFRTEAILINNKKGEELLDILKSQTTNFKEKDLDLLSKGNKVCVNYSAHPKRDLFKELITIGMPISKAANIVIDNYYDIGIVGMPGNNNYGGALTYYALYNVLRDSGKSVLFIQQPEDSEWKPSTAMNAYKNNPYKDFEFAKNYPNRDSMRELNQFCDMFMVGSDQFFASVGLYEFCNKFSSLDWVEDRKKKVAYAASFGRDSISCDDYSRAMMGFYLHRFDKFTVRESSAIDLCKKEFNLDTELVLDPVFLCSVSHYEKLIKNGNFQNNNKIATYVLDKTENSKSIIGGIKSMLNTDVLSIDDAYNGCNYNTTKKDMPKIEDWLSMIRGCKFLVTDSFHGMCFAIIFKKPFVALCNKERGAARFESMLKLLGLESRLINSLVDYQKMQEIDWDSVYEKLNLLKQKSYTILSDMITIPKNKKCASDYDLYKPDILNLKHSHYLMNKNLENIKSHIRTDFVKLTTNETIKTVFPNKSENGKIESVDLSVVVQGAINKEITLECLKSIRDFLPDAEIILSTWQGSDVKGLDYDILVLNKDPGAIKTDLVNNVTNNQNRQLVSTREGIKKASRKYILKLRTDFVLYSAKFLEYWNKFLSRHETYNIFRHKIIASSVFSRIASDFNHRPILFHPSDFFLLGLADDLKDYFDSIRLATDDELGNWQYLYPNKIPYPEAHYRYAPEQFFLLSYAKQFFDIKFEDWTDWNQENIELSKNILYNNFIFLDYKQSGIFSEKFAYELENPDKIYGLISFDKYENIYQKEFDSTYIKEPVEEVIEPVKPIGFAEYQVLNSKFKKHLSYFLKPFRKIFTWIWAPIPILYNLIKLLFNVYFVRRIMACFILGKAQRKKFRGDV